MRGLSRTHGIRASASEDEDGRGKPGHDDETVLKLV